MQRIINLKITNAEMFVTNLAFIVIIVIQFYNGSLLGVTLAALKSCACAISWTAEEKMAVARHIENFYNEKCLRDKCYP